MRSSINKFLLGILSLSLLSFVSVQQVKAQTEQVLVSNINSSTSTSTRVGGIDDPKRVYRLAQRISIGGSGSDSFILTKVKARFEGIRYVSDEERPKLSVYTNSNGVPGTLLAALTTTSLNSTSFDGVVSFTAPPNTTLNQGGKYWIVFEVEYTSSIYSNSFEDNIYNVFMGRNNETDSSSPLITVDHGSDDGHHTKSSLTTNTEEANDISRGGLWDGYALSVGVELRGISPNFSATGNPVITVTGSSQVGNRLGVDKSGISDLNGKPSSGYSYVWYRSNDDSFDASDNPIVSATSSTYTLTNDDVGKYVFVVVHFTDNSGYNENVRSNIFPSGSAIVSGPMGEDGSVTFDEDTTYIFTADDFGFTGGSDDDTFDGIKIQSLRNGDGRLKLDGSNVSTNDEISKSNIDDGKLKYIPDNNENGADFASFDFKVVDNHDTESVDVYTMTVSISPVNDPPLGSPCIIGLFQVGSTLTATRSRTAPSCLGIVDPEGRPGETSNGVPNYTFQWLRVDGTSSIEIPNATENTYTLTVDDSGKQVQVRMGYTDKEGTLETITSPPYPNNSVIGNPPTATHNTLTFDEDTTLVFDEDDFGFTAGVGSDATLASVVFVTIPPLGTLTLNNVNVSTGETIVVADINKLRYTPPIDLNGNNILFMFKVIDTDGLESVVLNTITFNIISVPDFGLSSVGIKERVGGIPHYIVDVKAEQYFYISSGQMRNSAFTLTNGKIVKARRIHSVYRYIDGRLRRVSKKWRLEIKPTVLTTASSIEYISKDCNDSGAICTLEGKEFPVSVNLDWSPTEQLTVSIGDASNTVEGGTMEFDLTLSRVHGGIVKVITRTTNEGTATSDEDFGSFEEGIVLFTHPKEGLTKTIGIQIKTDDDTEENETVIIKIVSATLVRKGKERHSISIIDNKATGTITDVASADLLTISVADATAQESDKTIDFEISLSGDPDKIIRVDYILRSGTTINGQDFRTPDMRTVCFLPSRYTPGETCKVGRTQTISIPIIDDSVDEGSETFTLHLRNPSNATILDGEAVGTITNSDPLQGVWLAGFGRTVSGQIVESISRRLKGLNNKSHLIIGGHNLDIEWNRKWDQFDTKRSVYSISERQLLSESSFNINSSGLGIWGEVSNSGFKYDDSLSVDGGVTTGIIGFDVGREHLTTGVAVSISSGKGNFDLPDVDSGEVKSTLTLLNPYFNYQFNNEFSVWGLFGYGVGNMVIHQADKDNLVKTDLYMYMGAIGSSRTISESDKYRISLDSDAFLTKVVSKKTSNSARTEVGINRLRLSLSGDYQLLLGNNVLIPGIKLGVLYNGGDFSSGLGLEIGGALIIKWGITGY